MATQQACPTCGTLMREIVWGYGTIADVADAGDVVIGGCVIDVDDIGRVAALQCPACGTRADEHGVALEKPEPATTEHPFAVAFSNPPPVREVTMTEHSGAQDRADRARGADSSPFVDEDFGGIASGGDWRDHVEPYASREDPLPQASPPSPEQVEPYASREDRLPERPAAARERVEPYASREDALPEPGAASPEHVDPYASREDPVPERGDGWRDRIDPFAAAVPPPAEPAIDPHARDTSDYTDAEEEGWPSRSNE